MWNLQIAWMVLLINQGNLSFKSIYGIKWKHKNVLPCIHQKVFLPFFELATDLIDVNIEAALQKCNEGIREAGHGMQRSVLVGSDKSST